MKVKLLPGATIPYRAHLTDAGMDLYSRETKGILPGGSATFDTGVCIELPPNTFGKVESRSGLNVKRGVVSCGGVIDQGYTGSIVVKLYNLSDEVYVVDKGERIAQLIILPYLAPDLEIVDELNDTDRGTSGFGSSGKH